MLVVWGGGAEVKGTTEVFGILSYEEPHPKS